MADKPPADVGDASFAEILEQLNAGKTAAKDEPTTTTEPVPKQNRRRSGRIDPVYPMRRVTYYQVSTSDIRSIGVAQAITTLSAAAGTFALSTYFDFSKDITLTQNGGAPVPAFLQQLADFAFWAWIALWLAALGAFLWRQWEWSRIKREHDVFTAWGAMLKWKWVKRLRAEQADVTR